MKAMPRKGASLNTDPKSDYEIPQHIKKRLTELDDPSNIQAAAQAEVLLNELEKVTASHSKWAGIGDGATSQGLDLKNTRIEETRMKRDALLGQKRVLRGDFHSAPQDSISVADVVQLSAAPTATSLHAATPLPTQPRPEVRALAEPHISTPQRRLTRLRGLGGDVRYVNGKWKTTKITELEKLERAEGFERCSQKTIRADLHEAFETERDAKRANFSTGLGQS